jgi:hypothetical protein
MHLLRRLLSCAVAALLVALWSPWLEAAEADLSKVLLSWQARRRAVGVLSAEIDGTVSIPKGLYTHVLGNGDEFPPKTCQFATQLSMLIDLRGGRARRWQKGMILHLDQRNFIPYCDVDLFDGRTYQTLRPRSDNSDASWTPGPYDSELVEQGEKRTSPFFRTADFPIFFALGIIPMTDLSIEPEHMKAAADSAFFKVVGKAAQGGRELVVVRSAPFFSRGSGYYQLWIDLPRNAAVVRWCAYVNDQRASSIEVSYKQMEGGWFPEAWTVSSYEIAGGPEKREDFHVKKLVVGPTLSPGDFHFQPTPGMVVYKSGEERRYVAGVSGIAETPLTEFLLKQSRPTGNRRLFWVILGNVIVLSALAGLVWWRKTKEGAQEQ